MAHTFTTTLAGDPTDPTLAVTRDILRREVARFMGINRSPANWSSNQTLDIDDIIHSGERMFYQPEMLPGENVVHVWSFMNPIISMPHHPTFTGGSITIANGVATKTGGENFPTWAGDGILRDDGVDYYVSARTNDNVLVMESETLDLDATTTYELRYEYILPEYYGGFLDSYLTYIQEDNTTDTVALTSVAMVLLQQQLESTTSVNSRPRLAAVTPVVGDVDNAGGYSQSQRLKLITFPTASEECTLTGRIYLNPYAMTNSLSYIYPLGGAQHAQTLIAACLAAAELKMLRTRGDQYAYYVERMRASVNLDRKLNTPKWFGYNGDMPASGPRVRHNGEYVTYQNTLYSGE